MLPSFLSSIRCWCLCMHIGIALIQVFIHILQLGLKIALKLRSLGFECGRQQSVLHREGIRMQIDIFNLKLNIPDIISKPIGMLIQKLTCSNDLSPLCLPQLSMSFMISSLTFLLLHRTESVPRTLFSVAHCFSTSVSGTTTAIMQLWKNLVNMYIYNTNNRFSFINIEVFFPNSVLPLSSLHRHKLDLRIDWACRYSRSSRALCTRPG